MSGKTQAATKVKYYTNNDRENLVSYQANKNKPPNSAHQKSRREARRRKEGKTEGMKKKKRNCSGEDRTQPPDWRVTVRRAFALLINAHSRTGRKLTHLTNCATEHGF